MTLRKPDSLRAWLSTIMPDYKVHPDRLALYVEGGQVNARQSKTLSYGYSYTLKVAFWDFAGSIDTVMVALLAWIEKEQPQLLRKADSQPFSFETDLLDSNISDLVIAIDLTESVIVHLASDGSGFHVTPVPEPDYSDPFDDEPPARFSHAIIDGEEIALTP